MQVSDWLVPTPDPSFRSPPPTHREHRDRESINLHISTAMSSAEKTVDHMLETDPNSAWEEDPLTIRAVGPDSCREEIRSISLTIRESGCIWYNKVLQIESGRGRKAFC